ncbi:2-oxoglutarate dehydrogenase complex dihydrolipoyllysine-residue succinyltransferase [Marinilabilia salmonicolor]|jgi:2-oxoglutarate dehydrogenase E2 component (dihydrolipoamide succinyltransferase)|uniref:Dihydrolipoyllysine-residue succinyltransferase n=1 Tax=Marinilabilia salmonicolor TaxID=989 RepID=A0A2T0WQ88_9BACT|nr:2-oxoglutarate dehydrogenase complex dihydrolipoyllysine-residue succinyltransferase [Marinilabilia salmonicolor]PRY88871.1 2-oxoglutarate dehydrogenase E2 component [Marinilabilia salmonicolor]RCW28848.1 2-oxoglutarate dehydrogenase E2 component [Marinilabilia salmonicolor]
MIDIKIPSPGESITEVELATWLVSDGDLVHKDQDLAEIESDKATLMLNATESGKISIEVEAGTTVSVGEVACRIDTSVEVPDDTDQTEADASGDDEVEDEEEKSEAPEKKEETVRQKPEKQLDDKVPQNDKVRSTPLAREKMKVAGLSVDDIVAGLKKLSASDVDAVIEGVSASPATSSDQEIDRSEQREKMSQLRRKLSQRLVSVKNETAMLTTFNEVDMSAIMKTRKQYQNQFVDKHGVKLGFMSFFMKASALALKMRPKVNSMIDKEEIVTPQYVDISVAVQTPKGLMVPVIRNVDKLSLADIELELKKLAEKARSGKISLEEMSGGTFTITNGGVFGSMLSTPLINPPQSAILGMHNIVERPVAVDGKVEVRPIMYIALSYDHRLIDGKDSVGFLMDVKKMLEKPEAFLSGGNDPLKAVLEL